MSHLSADPAPRFSLAVIEARRHAAMELHRPGFSPFTIGAVLLSPPVLDAIRRELRRTNPGITIGIRDVRAIVAREVIDGDILQGAEAEAAWNVTAHATTLGDLPD